MSREPFFIPTLCARCGADLAVGSIMSKFNLDQICIPCKKDEEALPNYGAADLAEVVSVRNGERNLSGIGLTMNDRQLLAQLRQARGR